LSGGADKQESPICKSVIRWKAGQFIENRHRPILDKDIRILCDLRASAVKNLFWTRVRL
jgi:hypothetical protein